MSFLFRLFFSFSFPIFSFFSDKYRKDYSYLRLIVICVKTGTERTFNTVYSRIASRYQKLFTIIYVLQNLLFVSNDYSMNFKI